MNLGLEDRCALVLAASSGLGFAIAAALATEGCRVAICSRDEGRVRNAVRRLKEGAPDGARVFGYRADVSNAEDQIELFKRAIPELGGLDVLICNAGGPQAGGFAALTEPDWNGAFNLTLMSVVRSVRLAFPHLRERGGGAVLAVVSSSVKRPIDNLLLSNVFRPAVQGLCKSIAIELAPENIRVNCIAPGRIETTRVDKIDRTRAEREGLAFEEVRARSVADMPMRRLGAPREFGTVAAFLCSDAASYVSGSTVLVDGAAVRCLRTDAACRAHRVLAADEVAPRAVTIGKRVFVPSPYAIQRRACKVRVMIRAMSNESDQALMKKIRAGDRNAFRVLIERYSRRLIGYATEIVGQSDDAQDVVQETFIRIWRHRSRWTPTAGTVSAYLYRVTRNLALNWRRDREVEERWTDDNRQELAPIECAGSPDDEFAAMVLRQEVDDAIAALPERRRLPGDGKAPRAAAVVPRPSGSPPSAEKYSSFRRSRDRKGSGTVITRKPDALERFSPWFGSFPSLLPHACLSPWSSLRGTQSW